MRILFIQHVPFETPSHLAVWAERNKHAVTVHRAYMEKGLRDAEPFDLIVPLGGPMSVHDADKLHWMKSEIDFLEKAVRNGKRVLGICLGAQMIARVLGASVYPNPEREIGWHPIRLTEPGKRLPLFRNWPEKFTAFHWHGETFAVPHGAVRFTESDACQNQGFIYENRILALQFHLESDAKSVEALIRNRPGDLKPGPAVQEESEILSGTASHVKSMHRLLETALNAWLR
jgi:GMP synthase-like glutamine amidotransferase